MTKLYKSILLALITVLFAAVLTGCGSIIKIAEFPISGAEHPSTQDCEAYDTHLSTLTVSVKPQVVEELIKPDKTLYNALFFVSVNGLSPMKVLIENSYFTYDLLTTPSWDAIDKLTEPTNINIELYSDAARTQLSVRESAFIYKIEEDYIYLGTAGHCIAANSKLKNGQIRLFDRTTWKVDLTTYELGGNFLSAKGDYAMYRIPTSSFSYDELLKLKQVTYSKEAVNNIKSGDYIYSGNIYAKSPKTDYDKKLRVISSGDDTYDHFVQFSSYKVLTYNTYYFTEDNLVKGQSGSALFDKYGNAVATTSGSGSHKTGSKNYQIGIFTKLYDIDTLYQKLKDKK